MKKILSLLVVMSLLVGVVGVLGDTEGQDGGGTATTDYDVSFDPSELNFGNIVVGESGSVPNKIIGSDSDLQINGISVAPDDTEGIFNDVNVLFSLTDSSFVSGATFTTSPIDLPASGDYSFYVQMTVPSDTDEGVFSGTITYTLMPAV